MLLLLLQHPGQYTAVQLTIIQYRIKAFFLPLFNSLCILKQAGHISIQEADSVIHLVFTGTLY